MSNNLIINVKVDPEMKKWITLHSRGNESAVTRAAIWFLMQQPNPDFVIDSYIRKPLSPGKIKGYEEKFRQEYLKLLKKHRGRAG